MNKKEKEDPDNMEDSHIEHSDPLQSYKEKKEIEKDLKTVQKKENKHGQNL